MDFVIAACLSSDGVQMKISCDSRYDSQLAVCVRAVLFRARISIRKPRPGPGVNLAPTFVLTAVIGQLPAYRRVLLAVL